MDGEWACFFRIDSRRVASLIYQSSRGLMLCLLQPLRPGVQQFFEEGVAVELSQWTGPSYVGQVSRGNKHISFLNSSHPGFEKLAVLRFANCPAAWGKGPRIKIRPRSRRPARKARVFPLRCKLIRVPCIGFPAAGYMRHSWLIYGGEAQVIPALSW